MMFFDGEERSSDSNMQGPSPSLRWRIGADLDLEVEIQGWKARL